MHFRRSLEQREQRGNVFLCVEGDLESPFFRSRNLIPTIVNSSSKPGQRHVVQPTPAPGGGKLATWWRSRGLGSDVCENEGVQW